MPFGFHHRKERGYVLPRYTRDGGRHYYTKEDKPFSRLRVLAWLKAHGKYIMIAAAILLTLSLVFTFTGKTDVAPESLTGSADSEREEIRPILVGDDLENASKDIAEKSADLPLDPLGKEKEKTLAPSTKGEKVPPRVQLAIGVADVAKRDAVKAEFLHAWSGYRQYAWGMDDLHPVSRRGSNGYNMALTMIDALDTLIIMGFDDEVKAVKQYVERDLAFSDQTDVSLFESTIRVMGGLLSAHALTGDVVYLKKAVEYADKLIVAFDTPTGLPYSSVDLGTQKAYTPTWAGGASTVSEVGTLQLEWRYISQATGDNKYSTAVDKATAYLSNVKDKPVGLFTRFINPSSGRLQDVIVTLGARVDSIYEYFLKAWLQSGKVDELNLKMYIQHMAAIVEHLLVKSDPGGLLYAQELTNGAPHSKMDHLVCYLPGLLALGADNIEERASDMSRAAQMATTCFEMYNRQKIGLAPEIVRFERGKDFVVDPGSSHNLLRPETVESLFYMWRVTHEQKYREWGWQIFESFRKHCRIATGGYSGLASIIVNEGSPKWNDHMESFFLAETLKYLYLLFDDDTTLPMDKWVFNTEGHPIPVVGTFSATKFKRPAVNEAIQRELKKGKSAEDGELIQEM